MTIRKLKEEAFNFFVNGEGDKTSLNTNRPKLRYFDEGLDEWADLPTPFSAFLNTPKAGHNTKAKNISLSLSGKSNLQRKIELEKFIVVLQNIANSDHPSCSIQLWEASNFNGSTTSELDNIGHPDLNNIKEVE